MPIPSRSRTRLIQSGTGSVLGLVGGGGAILAQGLAHDLQGLCMPCNPRPIPDQSPPQAPPSPRQSAHGPIMPEDSIPNSRRGKLSFSHNYLLKEVWHDGPPLLLKTCALKFAKRRSRSKVRGANLA